MDNEELQTELDDLYLKARKLTDDYIEAGKKFDSSETFCLVSETFVSFTRLFLKLNPDSALFSADNLEQPREVVQPMVGKASPASIADCAP